jgi:hypothetical protein
MDKATLDVTLALVTESLVQQAIIIESIPNEAFESIPSLRAFLNAEGVFQLNKALDSHAMSQIVAASPPFGQTGADLIAKLRNGISSMRADGASPSVAVLNPSDAASLDLSADAGGYVFATRDVGSSSPLWGLRVVERIGAGTESFIFAGPRDVGPLLSRNPSFRGRPLHGVQEEPLDSPARDQILVPCQERQGRAQGGGGMRYEVQDALVSYKDRLYSKGETLEATEEEMAGLLQAGYVKEVEAKKQSRKK